MLKKTITYVDSNGNEQTEDFFFNLNKTELTELELSVDGGLAVWLEQIVEAENASDMLAIMKKIILLSVGTKSADGKYFIKTDEVRQNFSFSPAFDILFMSLATDSVMATEFIKRTLPDEFAAEFDKKTNAPVVESVSVVPTETIQADSPKVD